MLSRSVLALHLLVFARMTGAKECAVAHSNTDGADDSPAIVAAFTECAQDSVITFAQSNYSVFTPVSLTGLSASPFCAARPGAHQGAENVTVKLEGNLLLPKNITEVQQQVNTTTNQPSSYAVPWFYIFGEEVSIYGSEDKDWGAFHG